MKMSEIKKAVICVDDDPMILQVLGFQLEKLIDSSDTIIELYTNPLKALTDIKEFTFDEMEIERIKEIKNKGRELTLI